jgi:AcrR family transcriptional regulator
MSTVKIEIATAARRLFAKSGIDGVSMRKVANQVGVSATAIYRHYRDKDALLDGITEEGFATFETYLRPGAAVAQPLPAIRALSRGLLAFALERPDLYEFLFIIPRKNVRQFPDDFAQHRSRTADILLRKVALGIERGDLANDDPLEVTLTVWAHVHGLISLYLAGRFGGDERRFRKVYRQSLERLLRGVLRGGNS